MIKNLKVSYSDINISHISGLSKMNLIVENSNVKLKSYYNNLNVISKSSEINFFNVSIKKLNIELSYESYFTIRKSYVKNLNLKMNSNSKTEKSTFRSKTDALIYNASINGTINGTINPIQAHRIDIHVVNSFKSSFEGSINLFIPKNGVLKLNPHKESNLNIEYFNFFEDFIGSKGLEELNYFNKESLDNFKLLIPNKLIELIKNHECEIKKREDKAVEVRRKLFFKNREIKKVDENAKSTKEDPDEIESFIKEKLDSKNLLFYITKDNKLYYELMVKKIIKSDKELSLEQSKKIEAIITLLFPEDINESKSVIF